MPFEGGRFLLKLSLAVFVLYKPESSANPFLGFSFLCAIRESQKLSTLPYIRDRRRRKHQTKADVPKIPSARTTVLLKRVWNQPMNWQKTTKKILKTGKLSLKY
jgi:hypothetical protein